VPKSPIIIAFFHSKRSQNFHTLAYSSKEAHHGKNWNKKAQPYFSKNKQLNHAKKCKKFQEHPMIPQLST